MKIPIIDTHIWLWLVSNDTRLEKNVKKKLKTILSEEKLILAGISLWETAMLVNLKRISLSIPFDEWVEKAASPERFAIYPINKKIAGIVASFPKSFQTIKMV
jgi:PIN domain nuclease of toxin-antitoxin system